MMNRTPSTGAELTEWRTAHGWSMRELGVRLGVHASSVSRAERRPASPLGTYLAGAVARHYRRAARRPSAWSASALREHASDGG